MYQALCVFPHLMEVLEKIFPDNKCKPDHFLFCLYGTLNEELHKYLII